MLKVLIYVVLGMVVVLLAARGYGAWRWSAETRSLRSSLESARVSRPPAIVDFTECEGLPPPVQRYFRSVLHEGSRLIAGVRLRHRGTFNLSETGEQWKTFTSDQQVVTRRPGFDWDARIQMLPGVPIFVHDAYVAGEGILHASLFGAVTLAHLRGDSDIARGEMLRFLAETAWYPTALLPSQGVRWSAIDDRSASATLTDGAVSVMLRITFLPDGPIATVDADARPRVVEGTVVPTPWHGRFWNYQDHEGVRVPMDGEVSWLLPDGARPYWRGRITQIAFTFAR